MPAELRLSFQKVDPQLPFDAPVPFTVHYGGADTEQFTFTNPLTEKALKELRWYLEEYFK